MGRGRGKGRRQSVVVDHDDALSGEDEKLPVRRRGRPQKPLKGNNIEEEDKVVKIEIKEEDGTEETKNSSLSKSTRTQAVAENGRKRKRPSQVKENDDPTIEENGVGNKTNATDLVKPVGYRQNGSRRKNKPRRAAEVGVECK